MAHRYFVEWSAPNYRNAGSTTVMADNQPDAVKKAKKKLGGKVKSQYLSRFDAWRVVGTPSRALPKGSIVVKHSLIKRVGR
jgi:hypothetical protein